MNEEPGRESVDGENGEARRLPWDIPPPPASRERIVSTLEASGLLRPRRRFGAWRSAALLAAAAALFAVGYLAGRREPAAPGGERAASKFVLFLSALPAERAEEEAARVAEYRSWAAGLRRDGHWIAGEKLQDGGPVLTGSVERGPALSSFAQAQEVSGYFVIEAKDLASAVSLARTCPHLRHGGRITVRAIVPA